MSRVYNKDEIAKIKEAGEIVQKCHRELKDYIKPGMTTGMINEFTKEIIENAGGTSPIMEEAGFPNYVCLSVSDCVVHGADLDIVLEEGDNITVDIVVDYQGYKADRGWTYPVGKISKKHKKLLKETEEALYKGIEEVRPGNQISNISNSIQVHAMKNKLGIVRELAGHGIGESIHEDPMILNYGARNRGEEMRPGMVFAIEPMLTLGTDDVYVADDDWSVMTDDGSLAAHFEHTVVVTDKGYEIVT